MFHNISVKNLWSEFVDSISKELRANPRSFVYSGVSIRDSRGRVGELCFHQLSERVGLYFLQNAGCRVISTEFLCALSIEEPFYGCDWRPHSVNPMECLQAVFTYWCRNKSQVVRSKMNELKGDWRDFVNHLCTLCKNSDLELTSIPFFDEVGIAEPKYHFVLREGTNGTPCICRERAVPVREQKELLFLFSISKDKPFCHFSGKSMNYYEILVTLVIADLLAASCAEKPKDKWEMLCDGIAGLPSAYNMVYDTGIRCQEIPLARTVCTYGFIRVGTRPALVHLVNVDGTVYLCGKPFVLDKRRPMQSATGSLSESDLQFLQYCCENADSILANLTNQRECFSGIVTENWLNNLHIPCIWEILPERYYNSEDKKTLESVYDALMHLKKTAGKDGVVSLLDGFCKYPDEIRMIIEYLAQTVECV